MDEKGVILNIRHASKALIRYIKRFINKLISQPGNREWVTMVKIVFNNNRHLSTIAIFKEKTKDLL